MPDYREIHTLQKDPARARSTAQYLFKLPDIEWTEWELDFLETISCREEDLSTRQGEKLVELRDAAIWYEKVDGSLLSSLINNCYLNRDYLSKHNRQFIERVKFSRATKLRRRDASRVMRCSRATGIIEPYHGCSLDPSRVGEQEAE
jgi:hypothetical protein